MDRNVRIAVLAILLVVTIVSWWWAFKGGFRACLPGTIEESDQKAVTALDGIVDLGITTSVALVGVGAAVLIGLKSSLMLSSQWMRLLLFVAVVCFGHSALAGVWWKLRVANAWTNKCLNLVREEILLRPFDLLFWFFIAGLIAVLVLVGVAAWKSPASTDLGDT